MSSPLPRSSVPRIRPPGSVDTPGEPPGAPAGQRHVVERLDAGVHAGAGAAAAKGAQVPL